jgi:hypothetical protein
MILINLPKNNKAAKEKAADESGSFLYAFIIIEARPRNPRTLATRS